MFVIEMIELLSALSGVVDRCESSELRGRESRDLSTMLDLDLGPRTGLGTNCSVLPEVLLSAVADLFLRLRLRIS